MRLSPALASRGLRPVTDLAVGRAHGTRVRYLAGCRCIDCRKANSLYSYEREVAVREGRGNYIVDAAPARRHIRKLSRRGVGYKQVASAASVSTSVVAGIRSGDRPNARRETIARILAVTPAARADHALVPGGPTWKLINELLAEGYTKAFLAEQIGAGRALQIRKTRVTVRTAARIKRLHRRLTT